MTADGFAFGVLENGLDFLRSSLQHLDGDPGKWDLKYAVLHLSSGVELVLKDRLQRDNWSLLFVDLSSVDRTAYETGDFTSVGLDECVRRLELDCGVSLEDSQLQLLKTFKKKRNKLEHLRSVESSQALKSSAYSVLSFLVGFIGSHFDPATLDPVSVGLLEDIRSRLGRLEEFIEQRKRDIMPDLQRVNCPVVECPSCLQIALTLAGEGAHCLFCGYRAEGERASAEYVQNVLGIGEYDIVKDGVPDPLHFCPECEARSLVQVEPNGGEAPGREYICFNCGHDWLEGELSTCGECGEPFAPVENEVICDDCFEQKINRDG